MKKRILTGLLAAAMALALTACGNQSVQQPQSPAQSPTATPDSSPAPETPATEETLPTEGEERSGVLVVYYSATGSTQAVAGYIANVLEGDTFAITPAESYSVDDLNWRDGSSRVSREHDDPALRAMELTAHTVDSWDDYDTVFIGYPIWWGIAAWPVDAFITANDFTGKTVIPFATSSSSGLGESGELLADLAGTGEWLEGRRFNSRVAEADVVEWIHELNLAG